MAEGRTRRKGEPDLAPAIREAIQTLRQIANCMAVGVINGNDFKPMSDKEKIRVLYLLQFDRKQIAAILGKDPDVVSVNLSQLRLTKGRGRNRAGRIDGEDR